MPERTMLRRRAMCRGMKARSQRSMRATKSCRAFYATTDSGATWNMPPGVGGAWPDLYRTAAMAYELPSPNGILTSSDGLSWSVLANTPNKTHLVGTGTNLYVCDQWSQSCWVGLETAPTDMWQSFAPPAEITASGSGVTPLAYDRDHHLLYTTTIDGGGSSFQGGIWRIVTP
jgi:hypothetical protein